MIGNIESSIFRNLTVPYGGVLLVHDQIDLFIRNVQITNIVTTTFYTFQSYKIGAPGFIFIGKNLYGTNICMSELSSDSLSIVFTYTNQKCEESFNMSSSYKSTCGSYSFVFGQGNCLSSGVNITSAVVSEYYATMHFAWYPERYYHTTYNCINNSGTSILGHSCSTDEEQICKYLTFIDNTQKAGLIGLYKYKHKIIDSYFIRNGDNFINTKETVGIMTLDRCYCDIETGATEINTRTGYITNVRFISLQCERNLNKNIFNSLKMIYKLRTQSCRTSKSNILFLVIIMLHS